MPFDPRNSLLLKLALLLANSRADRLLRFSSTPLPGRMRLLDLEVRADIDWWVGMDLSASPLPYMDVSFGIEDMEGIVGIPTNTLPYEASVYGIEVAMWLRYELASAPFGGRFFWRCD